MPKIVIVLLGPPGAGKGTQAELLKKRLKLDYISSGALIREAIARGCRDSLSCEIKKRYLKGIVQPDKLIIEMVKRKIGELKLKQGIIFDAFPLSIGQAKALEQFLPEFNLPQPQVIYLDLNLEESILRLSKRKICKKCKLIFSPGRKGYKTGICAKCGGKLIVRSDDRPEIVRKRYLQYKGRMKSLIKFYKERKQIAMIDGMGTIQKNLEEIIRNIK